MGSYGILGLKIQWKSYGIPWFLLGIDEPPGRCFQASHVAARPFPALHAVARDPADTQTSTFRWEAVMVMVILG